MLSKIDAFEGTFGKGSLQAILNGDTSVLEDVIKNVQNIQLSLDGLNSDKELLENQVDNITALVDAFDNGTKTFEECNKYIKNANDSLSEIKTNAENNVPSIVELTGGSKTSIQDIIDNSKILAGEYDKTMKSLNTSTAGTSGTAQDLYDLADSLDAIRVKFDEIDPLQGATAEQMQVLHDNIRDMCDIFDKLSQDYLKDANDLFREISEETAPATYEEFLTIGEYIYGDLIPNVKNLCKNLSTLITRYNNTSSATRYATSEASSLYYEVSALINNLTYLQDVNYDTASSYREMAAAAREAAAAAREAASAANQQAEAEASVSETSSSSPSPLHNIAQTLLGGFGFAKGTKSAPRGTSLVGEEEPELVWHRKKNTYQLVTDPSLVKLDAGDVVFNDKETSDIMSGRGISDIGDIKGFQSKMLKGVSNVPKTNNISNMSNKNETTIHVDKVELPNVRNGNDAEKLVAALCNLDGTVTQKLHS